MKRSYSNFRLRERSDRAGDRADRMLATIRHTSVGRVAPGFVGETLDGQPLRLSEYRGRVVLLVFGKAVCLGCVAFYPHQRALRERLAGRPFAVVGVHGGAEGQVAEVRAALGRYGIDWPVVWSRGPIGESPIELG